MRALRIAAAALVAFATVGLTAPGCNQATARTCTPGSEGFSDGLNLTTRTILEAQRPLDACRVRVEAIRNASELEAAYRDLGDLAPGGAPPVDFSKEGVILRENTSELPTRWVASRGAAAFVGAQACADYPPEQCVIQILAVPIPIERAELHTFSAIVCTGVSQPL